MNKFIIVDGLPYLYANGKAYAVRWDENGFTVGAEVKLTSVPAVAYSETSIKAKCAGHLDSIGDTEQEPSDDNSDDEQPETPEQTGETPETLENMEPETEDGAETPEQEPLAPEADVNPDFLEGMKLEALKEYASEHQIALNGARTKPAIIAVIKAASAE